MTFLFVYYHTLINFLTEKLKKVKKVVDIHKKVYYNIGVRARECPPTRNERNKK